MSRALIVAAGLAVVLGGCARNAVLELEIELPPEEGLALAELYVLSDYTDFSDAAWTEAQLEPLTELGDVARVDIVAEGASIERALGLRIRLCTAEPCPAGAPEQLVRIDRAFYVGERTWLRIPLPATPVRDPELLIFDRCEVGGCLDGDTLSYCRLDESHYCE